MPTGADANTAWENVEFKYQVASPVTDKPSLPATVTAYDTAYKAAAAKIVKIREGFDLLFEAPSDTPSNRTYRNAGERIEKFKPDIQGAPGTAPTLNLVFEFNLDDELYQGFLSAAAGTYATIYADVISKSGSGARAAGTGTSSPQGTGIVQIIQHGKASLPLPTGEMARLALTATWIEGQAYHYGPA